MDGIHFYAMSDLHISKKMGRISRALNKCVDGHFLLLAGDLTNDGKDAQFLKLKEILEKEISEIPVFSVSGNHDYPILPIPYIETDICSYYAFQEWLKVRNERIGVLWQQDESGAYAIQMENVYIIGLNATSHWRRFVFQQGKQLEWLEDFLQNSSAKWHLIICHAPLAEHNPLRKNGTNKTYLSRDGELQRILDKHQNVIFISGHTHVSPNIPEGCVDYDEKHQNIYINAGSICSNELKGKEHSVPIEWVDGNVMEINLTEQMVEVVAHMIHSGAKSKTQIVFGQ